MRHEKAPFSAQVPGKSQRHILVHRRDLYFDGPADSGITLLLVEFQPVGILVRWVAAEIDLNEIETKVSKEVIGIFLFMAVKPHALRNGIAVIVVSSGISACIAVNPRFQDERMDAVDHRFQSVRKTLGMNEQLSVLRTASEVPVVDVDIPIPRLLQVGFDQRFRLVQDKRIADIHMIGIPRTSTPW